MGLNSVNQKCPYPTAKLSLHLTMELTGILSALLKISG
jgi:hypothetical protein